MQQRIIVTEKPRSRQPGLFERLVDSGLKKLECKIDSYVGITAERIEKRFKKPEPVNMNY